MATVSKDITESNAKIDAVKRIVIDKASKIENVERDWSPLSKGRSWKNLQFSHPERTIRLGTVFSGIGAIEHAFQRLKLKHKIVFAGDIH